jgi:hypothetical protein
MVHSASALHVNYLDDLFNADCHDGKVADNSALHSAQIS